MVSLDESLVASSRRTLDLRLRPDLIIRQHSYQHKSSWVVKDPLSLRFFRFNDEEHAIASLLDGKHSLEEIKFEFERRFAPTRVTIERLWQFIASLHQGGLLLADTGGQGLQLKKRRDDKKRRETTQAVLRPLSVKFRGINPDPILNVIYPWIRWIYSPITVWLCISVMVSALLLVTIQYDVLASRLPSFHEFFSFQSAIWMMLALSLSKVIHEFGHAFTCKHFGGECHEMGMMFLVMTPAAYCNVSDAWMLPNKWHRIAISVAGIYSDLMIASIATFLWWFSGPGLFNHFCLNLMFVCSVSTLLFNANPLMRFDGYYVLSDLVEIPNLMQKSAGVLNRVLSKVCLGIDPPPDPMLPQSNQAFFAMYSIAAALYRWVIVISISMFLTQVFKPYGLQIFGQMMAVFAIGGMVIRPAFKLYKFLRAPGRWKNVKKPRLMSTLAVIAGMVAFICCVPLPHRVMCPLDIRAKDAIPVYIDEPGILAAVHVRSGQPVAPDTLLAELRSAELELQLSRLTTSKRSLERQLEQLHRQSFSDPSSAGEIVETQASLAAVDNQIELAEAKQHRLKIKAPAGGVVLSPPDSGGQGNGDGLPARSGSLIREQNVGTSVQAGELLCLLAQSGTMEAVVLIDQSQVEFVRVGQPVELNFMHLPGTRFSGVIERISNEDLERTPIHLTTKGGGDVVTTTDSSGRERPQSSMYAARVRINEGSQLLRVGMRGEAKIAAESRTVWQRVSRVLQQTFHFAI